MPHDCKALVESMKSVCSLPASYQRVNDKVDDPKSSVADIAKTISMDQGLSARLLKLANSAFYGFPSRIETISSAVMIIGARELRDLALATAVISMFKDVPPALCDMKSFWRHSLACGLTSRLLAVRHAAPPPRCGAVTVSGAHTHARRAAGHRSPGHGAHGAAGRAEPVAAPP